MTLNYNGKILFFGLNFVESYKDVASKLKVINWKNFKAVIPWSWRRWRRRWAFCASPSLPSMRSASVSSTRSGSGLSTWIWVFIRFFVRYHFYHGSKDFVRDFGFNFLVWLTLASTSTGSRPRNTTSRGSWTKTK